MRVILHILTRPPDVLVTELIRRQEQQADSRAEVADLTQPQPDYAALLERVFAADSVEVW